MISKSCGFGLLIGGVAALAALPAIRVISSPLAAQQVQVQVPGRAPVAPAPAPDLQKQVDDALKELDKLEKIVPDQPENVRRQIDDVRNQMRQQLLQGPQGNLGMIIGPNAGFGGGPIARTITSAGQGRWGIMVQRPDAVLVDQLKLPAGQGVVVSNVLPESPAAKAGILKYDILLEVDGKVVSSDLTAFNKDAREIKADVEVSVSVLRRGQKETIKSLKLPEAKAEVGGNIMIPQFPGQPGLPQRVAPNFQAIPPGFNGGVLQIQPNLNEAMSVQVANDEFTIKYSSGALKATVKGKRDNGKATLGEINIEDGDTKVSAREIDQVPERYRPTITRMMESVK